MARNVFVQTKIQDIIEPLGSFISLGRAAELRLEPCPYFGVCELSTSRIRSVPPPWAAEIRDARVHQPSLAVSSQQILWQLDHETELPFESAGYSSHFEALGLNEFAFRRLGETAAYLDRAILLANRVSYSYFHLAFEQLPKLDLLFSLPEYAHWPVIADGRLRGAARDLLTSRVGTSREIIWLPTGGDIVVSRLVVLSSQSHLPDDPALKIADAVVARDAVSNLARFFGPVDSPEREQFLWVTRRHYAEQALSWGIAARDIHNSSEIDSTFAELGATVCAPETLSLARQRQVFGESSMVGMAAGSAVTNLIFCRPQTKVIIVSQSANVNPGLLFALAQALNLDVCWVFGFGTPCSSAAAHWPFVVDPLNIGRAAAYLRVGNIQPDGFIPFSDELDSGVV